MWMELIEGGLLLVGGAAACVGIFIYAFSSLLTDVERNGD